MDRDRLLQLSERPLMEKVQNATYLTFLVIGIGLLWPWNNILSATLYFQNNLFQVSSIYAKLFTSSMMSVSTVTSLGYNLYLAPRQHSYTSRVINGLKWQTITFIALTLLCTMSSWLPMGISFILVMVLVSMSAISTALTQNGVMAIANVFGPEFSQGVMLGQAIAGVLPSFVLFLVSFANANEEADETQNEIGVLLYFLVTSLVSYVCIILIKFSGILEKFTNLTASAEITVDNSNNVEEMEVQSNIKVKVRLIVLYYKLKYLALSIFTACVVTLIFPVFAANTHVGRIPLSDAQYIPLVFTIWNAGDLYGRVLADLPTFRDPKFSTFKTFIYSMARIALVPFFFLFIIKSKYSPKSFILDILYLLLQFLFGVTNGHVISISYMKVPEELTTDDEKEAAGGFINLFLSTGLAVGSIISYIVVYFIDLLLK
ncbi:hypothetical protein KAFR_0K00660 [Kazachstania africana CBS 2517]|uniref:Nucleoside transporter FUN26 n=1 Tax=Kazachstania africana (strain ATCC 22294 / BCRC 22015 / CBS 2517 / CECT 1963 / NBRC 1671 / NRRL Y-8276) TaxID=1071382 RepID=H2B1C1_KAZAF|nr:hypothetical protein KAFR_0K00660 [Kazachstania africana CBS 2517]CCF60421.1 hypothetical protein KAFR_0K00660 [Kazachstania africana CBS 2517]